MIIPVPIFRLVIRLAHVEVRKPPVGKSVLHAVRVRRAREKSVCNIGGDVIIRLANLGHMSAIARDGRGGDAPLHLAIRQRFAGRPRLIAGGIGYGDFPRPFVGRFVDDWRDGVNAGEGEFGVVDSGGEAADGGRARTRGVFAREREQPERGKACERDCGGGVEESVEALPGINRRRGKRHDAVVDRNVPARVKVRGNRVQRVFVAVRERTDNRYPQPVKLRKRSHRAVASLEDWVPVAVGDVRIIFVVVRHAADVKRERVALTAV